MEADHLVDDIHMVLGGGIAGLMGLVGYLWRRAAELRTDVKRLGGEIDNLSVKLVAYEMRDMGIPEQKD